MAAFSLGYSLPLAGAVVALGFGFGKLGSMTRKFAPIINVIAGTLLIGVGFYLLATA
jgi:cytochrome c biogenesis protein CcdA